MAAEKKDAKPQGSNKDGVSDEEARKESSKIAKQASEAHQKATELLQAAVAAGDPEERQKLIEQALEQHIQSKSLGKTAKYLRSGTFQGMAVGAGLGIAPGASLGAISGTLVGGVSSTALGGLGAGIGAATGAIHGPFWNLGEAAGKGIQKITENLPGWKATESQKKQLEKMVGQINEQDAPGKDELESWMSEGGSEEQKEIIESAKSAMPSMSSAGNSGQSEKKGNTKEDENKGAEPKQEQRYKEENSSVQTKEEGRKKPRKLQMRGGNGNPQPDKPAHAKKQPRKLEKRSA